MGRRLVLAIHPKHALQVLEDDVAAAFAVQCPREVANLTTVRIPRPPRMPARPTQLSDASELAD
jgi:hypothetical protein